jgi:hypothetical protein
MPPYSRMPVRRLRPPASQLRLRYPRQDKTLRDQKQLMQQLGISSLDELWTRHRNADQIIGRYFQPAGSTVSPG